MAMTPEEEAAIRAKAVADYQAQQQAKAAADAAAAAEEQRKRQSQSMFMDAIKGIWDNIGTIILAAIFLPVIYNLIHNENVQKSLGGLVNWFCELVGIENVNGVQMVQGWVLKLDVLANENLPAGFVREDAMGKLLDFYAKVEDAKKEFEGKIPPAILNAITKNQATWDAFRKTLREANDGKTNIPADLTNDKVIYALLTKQPYIVRDILNNLKTTGADGKTGEMPPEIIAALRTIINDNARFRTLLTGNQLDLTIEAIQALNPSLASKSNALKQLIQEALKKDEPGEKALRELFNAALNKDPKKIEEAFKTLATRAGLVIAMADPKAIGTDGNPMFDPIQQKAIAALQTPSGQNAVNALEARLGTNNTLLTQALTTKDANTRTTAFLTIARTTGVLPQAINFAAQLPPEALPANLKIDMPKLNRFIQAVDEKQPETQLLFTAVQKALPAQPEGNFNFEPIIPAFLAMSVTPQLLTEPKAKQAQEALADLLGSLPDDAAKGEKAQANFKQVKTLLSQHRDQTFAFLSALGSADSNRFMAAVTQTAANPARAVMDIVTQSPNPNVLPQFLALVQHMPAMKDAIPGDFGKFSALVQTLNAQNPEGVRTLLRDITAAIDDKTGAMDVKRAAPALASFVATPAVTTNPAAKAALVAFITSIPDSAPPEIATLKNLFQHYSEPTFTYLNALGPDGVRELFAALKTEESDPSKGAMLHFALKYATATREFAKIDPEKLSAGQLKEALKTIRGINDETFALYASIDKKTDIVLLQNGLGDRDKDGQFTVNTSKVAACVFNADQLAANCRAQLGQVSEEVAALTAPALLSAANPTPQQVAAVKQNIDAFLAFSNTLDRNAVNGDPVNALANGTVRDALKKLILNHDATAFGHIPADAEMAFFANPEHQKAFTTLLASINTAGLPAEAAQLLSGLTIKYANGKTGAEQLFAVLTDPESLDAILKRARGETGVAEKVITNPYTTRALDWATSLPLIGTTLNTTIKTAVTWTLPKAMQDNPNIIEVIAPLLALKPTVQTAQRD